MSSVSPQGVLFPDIFSRPIHVTFDEPNSTSDGGAILLKALDKSLGVSQRLAACLRDPRQQAKVQHEYLELLRQRVFALSCGYEDANDATRASSDCMQRLLVGREPGDESCLASQPTLSRFENAVSRTELYRMADSLCELVVERHRKRLQKKKVKRVTIDIDATCDRTHGAQQLSLFNGFYDTRCYLPLLGFLTFNEEPQQYLFGAILRPGVSGKEGLLAMLQRILAKVRSAFPGTKIRIRLDGGFAGPEVLDFLDAERVEYLVGMATNSVLKRRSARLLGTTRRMFREQGETVQLFGETQYAAGSWKTKRRIIYKAEVVAHEDRSPRDNVRYVVTNFKQSAKFVYKEYVKRCDSENRIKELKEGLHIDRTSCSSFTANQFRVLLSAAAFVFFQEIQLRARRTGAKGWQVSRIRLQLFKIAGKLVGSARRLVLHLSEDHPWADVWMKVARSCGAVYT